MDNYTQQKRMLVDAILMLERAGIIDFNGHASWRVPGENRMLINSGASVRSALTIDDIVMTDFDGKPVDGGAVPPMEFHIHSEIYRRRADVGSVIHAHPLWSTLFSMTGNPVEPVIMQAAVIGEIMQFGEIASINTKELGEALATTLGAHRIAMLKSHGSVIAAASILEAFVLAVYLEENTQRQYLAKSLGTPTVLTPEQVATIAANLWKPNLLQKVWDYHAGKLGPV
ncbi:MULTISPECIES: class II aldolase/adducin family protein [Phyllobacterium]|jgi:L-fuculose-phosphate aldolase|uniref:L-fuculose-phosphate aldolase n=1 Tax=Phyllobacterium trifolii TaxID=300193 RepID=A0A839U7B7_9HYPH|nr:MULTISPECIES: class II aldolase/adducin family protein [Phyllobacterium]MBB3147026.1 L-fuculose-phosphate aldolase [Phyllobacterium trifolii]MBZ9601491.1 class II aldolase/adducin family protein [Phyllobacterium sp. KW56]